MSRKKVAILSFSDIAKDGRVLKQFELASQFYEVDSIGFGVETPEHANRHFPLKSTRINPLIKYSLLFTGFIMPKAYTTYFWRKPEYREALEILRQGNYDLIHANDWDALPIAVAAAHNTPTKVLFDAHEYTPAQTQSNFLSTMLHPSFIHHLFSVYQNGIDEMVTVSNGILDLYTENFGWKGEIIMNTFPYVKRTFKAVNPEHIELIHHGGALPSRYIEQLIEVVPYLDPRFRLNLMLVPSNQKYFEKLKLYATKVAPDRIRFHEAVSRKDLMEALGRFDIGLPFIKATQLNNLNALPNKFFESMMAGLVIVVSPLPVMKKIVEEHQLGLVAKDQSPKSVADALNSLTVEEINQFKKNSLQAAKILNSETDMAKLQKIYQRLLNE